MQSRRDERRLRILTLTDQLGYRGGGAEKLAREILVRLDPNRFDRVLCVSRWPPAEAQDGIPPRAQQVLDRLENEGVAFMALERGSRLHLRSWRPLIERLRRDRVDVLHSHQHGSSAWAALLGTLARTPVVIAHEHSWSFEGQVGRRFLDRELIARRADAVIAVNSEDRRRMIELVGINPGKVVIVPNGITPLALPRHDVRRELGIAADQPVIGTVTVLRPEKALPLLVRATVAVRARVPRVRVLIAGGGPEYHHLQALIDDLGLAEIVTLLGFRNDVPDLLKAFDVAVCCSEFEGSPLSVMEYMEAALPVVATRVGGLPDLIEHGVNGLLVERGDVEALASSLGELLADPDRAAELGRRGQERRRMRFDLDATVRRIERLYLELHAAKNGRRPDGPRLVDSQSLALLPGDGEQGGSESEQEPGHLPV